MAENFYEMYLEEMELIRPLDLEEEKRVLRQQPREIKRLETVWQKGIWPRRWQLQRNMREKSFPFLILFRRPIWLL